MSRNTFYHQYYIEEGSMTDSFVQIVNDDPNCKTNCEIQIPFQYIEEFHRYLGERIDYLKQHGFIEEKKGGTQ